MHHNGFSIYGNPTSKRTFLQLVDMQEHALPEQETALLEALSGDTGWCIVPIPIKDWNPGNHFMDVDRRMVKGMAWMLISTRITAPESSPWMRVPPTAVL